jgi:hypothetical protein
VMNYVQEKRYPWLKIVAKGFLYFGLSGCWFYWLLKVYEKYKLYERRIQHLEVSTEEALKRIEITSSIYSMGLRNIHIDRGDIKIEFWLNFFSGAQEYVDIMAYVTDHLFLQSTLLDKMERLIASGKKIRIILGHPHSSFIYHRSTEMGHRGGEHHELVGKTLKSLEMLSLRPQLHQADTRCFEVRLLHGPFYCSLFRVDRRMMVDHDILFQSPPGGIQKLILEIEDTSSSCMFEYYSKHFDAAWESSESWLDMPLPLNQLAILKVPQNLFSITFEHTDDYDLRWMIARAYRCKRTVSLLSHSLYQLIRQKSFQEFLKKTSLEVRLLIGDPREPHVLARHTELMVDEHISLTKRIESSLSILHELYLTKHLASNVRIELFKTQMTCTILIFDDEMFVTHYLPRTIAEHCPLSYFRRRMGNGQELFEIYSNVFDTLWEDHWNRQIPDDIPFESVIDVPMNKALLRSPSQQESSGTEKIHSLIQNQWVSSLDPTQAKDKKKIYSPLNFSSVEWTL